MAAYEAKEIRKGIYAIEEGMVRSYLFIGEGESLLIDTGASGGELRAFCESLAGCVPHVLLTHADGDHTSAVEQFESVYMSPAEYAYHASKGRDTSRFLPLWEGDRFQIGEYTLEVVSIPGHTPGSVAFLDRAHRFLVSGDSISRVPIFMFGEGRNFHAYIASMQKLEGLRREFDCAFAAHGEAIVGADILPTLIEGAKAYLAGELQGEDPGRPMPAKVYAYKDVRFLG